MSFTEVKILYNLFDDWADKMAYTKPLFERTLQDKTIPLEVRWDLFIKAPYELHDHMSYYAKFNSLPEDTIGYSMEYHVERYQTVLTTDLVDWYEESLFDTDKYTCRFKNPSTQEWIDGIRLEQEDQAKLNALKEEILSLNLWSYTYDW